MSIIAYEKQFFSFLSLFVLQKRKSSKKIKSYAVEASVYFLTSL